MRNHIFSEDIDIIALQEAIKQDFEDWELKELSGNLDFAWFWSPSKEHSGGLIMGVRSDSFEVEDTVFDNFFMGVLLRNRCSNFRF